jgi:pimeloyl-ACP methyl ester carboxylesterase
MRTITDLLRVFAVSLLITAVISCTPTTTPRPSVESATTVNSADGSPILYGVEGQGDLTVVFIHCWTCNHQFWKPQINYFSASHQVLWLDLAGHGNSGSNRNHYTMQAFAEDVAAVVNRVESDNPVVLVGHSMGGPVAIETAKLLGDRVIGIVGVDTFYTPFEWPKTEAGIEDFVRPFKKDFRGTSENMVRSMFTPHADPEVIDWVLAQLSTADPEMGVSAMYSIFRWSADNNPGTLQQYAGMLRNINGAPTGEEAELDESVILVPGVGHFPAQVKPEEFNQILETILVEFQAH